MEDRLRAVSPVEFSVQSKPIGEKRPTIDAIVPADRVDAEPQKASAKPWTFQFEFFVLSAWLAGVLILSTRLAIGFGVTLWIRVNVKPLSEEFEQRVRLLGDRLRGCAEQRVFTTVRVGQAVAAGFIRPIVLIPAAWLTELTPEMLEAVIAHELAHIRRWDLWVNLVQRVVETLLFYHPAVWWLSRRIRLEREMCCDEIAAGCFDRVTYARSLESVAKIAHGNLLMVASINGGKNMNLLSRVQYLFGSIPKDAGGNWWAAGFVAMVLPFAMALVFSLTCVTAPAVAIAQQSDDSEAIEKIERLGGRVTRDENSAGNPVVEVSFGHSYDRFNETHMSLLKGFTHLRRLNLWNINITDESLKELTDIKTLEFLDLSYTKGIGPNFTRITDAGLKHLKDLRNLKSLNLWQARITDEGLKDLKGLTELTDLNLTATKITDVGLKELKVLKNLSVLALNNTEITDGGLKEISEISCLTVLELKATKVTDAGLRGLKELMDLKSLDLSFNRITGTGLKGFEELKSLSDLNLEHGLACDDGLKVIGKLKSLRLLRLDFCDITDAGLNELTGMNTLKELDLTETQVTNAGIQELKKSLPNVKIIHRGSDQEVFDEPSSTSSDESKAIEKIELLGGKVTRDGDLPNSPVIEVDFPRGQKVTNDDLLLLKAFPSVRSLGLKSTQLTDEGLKNSECFRTCPPSTFRKTCSQMSD